MKRLLDHDPLTGITEWFHYDHTNGNVHIETTQDVDPILDVNKELANDEQYTRDGMKDDMWHFARIPVVVQLQWLKEYGLENDPMNPKNKKLLFRLLNSPEWKYLKTTNKIHI